MIKILFTIPNFITAGSGRVLANIVKGLDRTNFEPTVCVSRRGGQIQEELEASGIRVLEFPFTVHAKPYLSLIARLRKVASFFKPYQFDLWHSFHYADDYTEPLIAHFSGAKAWVYTKKSMMWGSRAWILRSLLATRIIADNHDMPQMFFNKYNLSKKVRIIPHGVDLNIFHPFEGDNDAFRAALDLSEEAILVGLIAHIVPVKGHAILIEAAAHLPQVHLMFAGRTNDQECFVQLKNLAETLQISHRVHFLGNVSNVPEFLAQMDIVAMPTTGRGEGCPVALLEAMACGKACVATNVPGSRDIIEDGISGLLVEPENAEALAKAINRLIEDRDLREKMGEAARQRVETSFSIECEVAAHEQLYLELMGGKR